MCSSDLWFVVDGGLEKNGTGAEHGVFASGHRVSVNPGETVSVSAGLSYVDGPQVGDIEARVRSYDADSILVAGSEQTVISEAYAGSYTGTYVVPATGAEIELGFYTGADVHANTRARIDNLNVQRGIQYLARYEWEGEPHNSPSIKRDHTGEIVARNLMLDPSFEAGTAEFRGFSSLELARTTWGPRVVTGNNALVLTANNVGAFDNRYVQFAVDDPGGWVSFFIANFQSVGFPGGVQMRIGFSAGTTYTYTPLGNVIPAHSADGGANDLRVTAQVPAGTRFIRVLIYPRENLSGDAPVDGRQFTTDGWVVALGDTQGSVVEQTESYWDGDSPDVVDEGSREGSFSFPFFPVFLADSTVQGEHELRVEGDAPVWPVWEIVGPGRDVEIVGPDGSRLFVEGEVTSPITIVTEPGKRSIRDASGLIWDRMKPDDDQFFALEPGEQTIKMTMVGGNPESTIKAVYSENWKTPRGTAQGMIGGRS